MGKIRADERVSGLVFVRRKQDKEEEKVEEGLPEKHLEKPYLQEI